MMQKRQTRRVPIATVAVAAAQISTMQFPAAAQNNAEDPKDVIAVQLRRQGYVCDDPESAKRDLAASKVGAPVWILTCKGVKYRVRLVPDLAAQVEKLD
jgi:hypothetical protein